MKSFLVLLAIVAVVYVLAVWAPKAASGEGPDPAGDAITLTVQPPAVPLPPSLAPQTYAGHDAHWWETRSAAWRRAALRLHRTLTHEASVSEAIGLACSVYGDCSTLWRRARCESHLYRFAQNASGASGLFQFLPSTWQTTPFARFSVFSAYANALAAGWMIDHGRGGEWVCR